MVMYGIAFDSDMVIYWWPNAKKYNTRATLLGLNHDTKYITASFNALAHSLLGRG